MESNGGASKRRLTVGKDKAKADERVRWDLGDSVEERTPMESPVTA